jgi:hypothetical protein
VNVAASTERLIEILAREALPVRPLPSPARRAALWLLGAGAVAGASILAFADLHDFARRADWKLVTETVAAALTGVAAVLAAFHLSIPGRPRFWALLPLPPFLAWLASSGLNCWRHWITYGPDGSHLGESAECFHFILGVSLPLLLSLLYLLRRALPLTPIRVAALGGLGVAGIAAFILQFFHRFDVTFMDLGGQVLGIAAVAGLASAWESLSARRRRARSAGRR